MKNLLPKKNYYKANLHCHSTLSDGLFSPEELKAIYKEKGYSIVAFTDHDYIFSHTNLADAEFLPLSGYEMQILDDRTDLIRVQRDVMHLNFYAKDPSNTKLIYYDPKLYYEGDPNRKPEFQVTETYQKNRVLTPDGINDIIREAKENGFIVCLNHPTWSFNDRRHYCGLEGLFAMEIYNHTCMLDGHDAYCPTVYDEMLRDGQRISCIAADDNHNRGLSGIPKLYDSFGGFTMIAADSLDYDTIIKALECGDFYASRGPIIHELYVEDNVAHISFSDAEVITLSCGSRRDNAVRVGADSPINSATFEILETDKYLRFTVTDKFGRTANTRAYWRDEFAE